MVNKLYDLAAMQEEVPATVKAHYEQLSANAGDCVQCGGCESRCPFGVRIVDRMKKTRELFGEMCIRDRNLAGTQVAFVKISRGLLRCDSLGHSRIFCSLQLCPHPFLQGAVVIYDACNPDGGVFRNGLYNPQLFIRKMCIRDRDCTGGKRSDPDGRKRPAGKAAVWHHRKLYT